MKKSSPKTAAPSEELRIGKDEMNLAERPFAGLKHEKGERDHFTLEWEQVHPDSGKKLKAAWKVQGGAEVGLPGPFEERLYLVLMELSREQGWPQRIYFSRAELLTRLGTSKNAKNYAQLATGLERLKAVSIRADNSFWDVKRRDYATMVSFGILNDTVIIAEPDGRKGQGQLPLSSVEWHSIFWNSMKDGHLRSIDIAFALALRLPLSLRLYRYLDKHRYGKNGTRKSFEIEIHKLCHIHLNMEPTPFVSKAKERLAGAHHELIEKGFLAGVIFKEMKTTGGTKVCYTYAEILPATLESVTLQETPETPFTNLKPDVPLIDGTKMSEKALSGFLRADEKAWEDACDLVFEALPEAEKTRIREAVRRNLPPFLQENMNTFGAKSGMSRGIRKEMEVNYEDEVQKKLLERDSN